MSRKRTTTKIETKILRECRRRCCLCVALESNLSERDGQIAHIDRDNKNNKEENLAFLCLRHHDKYDTRRSQSKGFTQGELKSYKQDLLDLISENDLPKTETNNSIDSRVKYLILFLLAVLSITLIIFAKPFMLTTEKQNKTLLLKYFESKDSLDYNILITRFEDYRSDNSTTCIGRSIEENINVTLQDINPKIKINIKYIDSLETPRSKYEASKLATFHNVDLLIYGLAKNIESDCSNGEVCFRYQIEHSIPARLNSSIDFKKSKHDLEYISTSPAEIEKGNLQIDILKLSNWVTGLVNLNFNNTRGAYWQFDKVISDKNSSYEDRCYKVNSIVETYYNAGEYLEGSLLLDNYMECGLQYDKFYTLKAEFYRFNNQLEEAVTLFSKAIEKNPNNMFARIARADILLIEFNEPRGLKDLEYVITGNYSELVIPALMDRANYFYSKNKYLKAISDVNKIIEIDKESDKAYNLKSLCHMQLQNYEESKASIAKAILIDPNSAYYRNSTLIHHLIGEFDKAMSDINKALNKDSTNSESLALKAILYNKNYDNLDNAFKYAKLSLQYNKDSFYANEVLAEVYYKRKKYDKAIEFYGNAIRLDSSKTRLYNSRAICYRELNMYLPTIKDMKIAIKQQPNQANLHFNIYFAYREIGDFVNAFRSLEVALKLDPLNQEYKKDSTSFVNILRAKRIRYK